MCSLATERRECRGIFDFDVGTTTAATLAFTTTTTGVSAPAATSATSATSISPIFPLIRLRRGNTERHVKSLLGC